MVSADYIKEVILAGLPCDYIDVQGDDGTHFNAVIVSAEFSGRNRVQRHQLVYQALGDRMRAVNLLAKTEVEVEIVSPHFFDPEGERLRG